MYGVVRLSSLVHCFRVRLEPTRVQHLNALFANRAQCYTTFYVCNLQKFVKARVFVLGMPFQPCLVFVSKVKACSSEAPFKPSALG